MPTCSSHRPSHSHPQLVGGESPARCGAGRASGRLVRPLAIARSSTRIRRPDHKFVGRRSFECPLRVVTRVGSRLPDKDPETSLQATADAILHKITGLRLKLASIASFIDTRVQRPGRLPASASRRFADKITLAHHAHQRLKDTQMSAAYWWTPPSDHSTTTDLAASEALLYRDVGFSRQCAKGNGAVLLNAHGKRCSEYWARSGDLDRRSIRSFPLASTTRACSGQRRVAARAQAATGRWRCSQTTECRTTRRPAQVHRFLRPLTASPGSCMRLASPVGDGKTSTGGRVTDY